MTTSPYLRRQPVKNFLLVRERDRRRLRELRLLAFAVIPAALALLAYTWLQTEIVRSGYRVRALERRLEEMAKTERQLELESSWLESLERVEAAAAEALEMQFPTLEQMVFVEAPGGGWEEGEAIASGAAIGSADALAAGGAGVER